MAGLAKIGALCQANAPDSKNSAAASDGVCVLSGPQQYFRQVMEMPSQQICQLCRIIFDIFVNPTSPELFG